jgi:hypothetical protein
VFPTAPLPANDRTIGSGTWADQWYLDDSPLYDALRGKRWVLATRCVEVATPGVRANLFQAPGGYVMPVTFGGKAGSATVRLRNVSGPDNMKCEALHPGAEKPVRVQASFLAGELELQARSNAAVRWCGFRPGERPGSSRRQLPGVRVRCSSPRLSANRHFQSVAKSTDGLHKAPRASEFQAHAADVRVHSTGVHGIVGAPEPSEEFFPRANLSGPARQIEQDAVFGERQVRLLVSHEGSMGRRVQAQHPK